MLTAKDVVDEFIKKKVTIALVFDLHNAVLPCVVSFGTQKSRGNLHHDSDMEYWMFRIAMS